MVLAGSIALWTASGFLALPSAPASHGAFTEFNGSYEGAAGWMSPVDPNLGVAPVFGASLCAGQTNAGSAGGACPQIVVNRGDSLTVHVEDNTFTDVAFAVCVDTNWDSVCRPEIPDDWLYFSTCPNGGILALTHNGPPGPMLIFLMAQADLSDVCSATSGFFSGLLSGSTTRGPECSDGDDNDGDGSFDLADAECLGPSDDDEAIPECSDLVDNDGDLLVDMMDPNCTDPSDRFERTIATH